MNKLILLCLSLAVILAHMCNAQWNARGGLSRSGIHGSVSYRGRRFQISGHYNRNWRGGHSYGVSGSWSWGKKRSKLPAPAAPCNFHLYDIDNDGVIQFLEFDASARHVNLEEVMKVFRSLDSDGDEKVTKEEFKKEAALLAKEHIFKHCKKQ